MEVDIENRKAENFSSPLKHPSTPGTPQPLQPVSFERQNQQRIPQSPSLPSNLDGSGSPRKTRQHRLSDAADVKARVAYLNTVSQNGSPIRSTSPTKLNMSTITHAAIQRAMLGREEAETAMVTLTAQIESHKVRERQAGERIEHLFEKLEEARNRQKHERTVYEKEIKLIKKAEFKAEMAVIKLQEELRETRSELEGYKVRSDHEKAEKEKARQEAFERAYAIAGMTEELQDVKQQLEVAKQERDTAVAMAASKMPIQEEKPTPREIKQEEEVGDKRKMPTSNVTPQDPRDVNVQSQDASIETKYAALRNEVYLLRQKVQEDFETIHFMNMQCQFKACPCRIAERDGVRFVHDYDYDAKVRTQNAKRRKLEELQPQLPLPRFKSWKQKQEERKGKQALRQKPEPSFETNEHIPSEDNSVPDQQSMDISPATPSAVIDEPIAPLPPSDIMLETPGLEQDVELVAAANVPLPSPNMLSNDQLEDTLEGTAQLEDLTQVIVEPGNSAQAFLFSTSTMSNRAVPDSAPALTSSHNVRMSDDLFDISPPKRNMPPRPSTALGVLTVESPIRLVANSPLALDTQSVTAVLDLARPRTTRIALNDISPVQQSRQAKHQPRPIATERSRGRSPADLTPTDLDQSSPATTTFFPITPATKHERSNRHRAVAQPRPQTAQDHYPPTRNETSTTTTVPLRDENEHFSTSTTKLSDHNQAGTDGTSASGTPFSVPGTPNMTREQALAQIRARRDRARSINMRKSAEEGSKTPGSVARRGLKERLGETGGEGKGRDFSQASAPGRI